MAFVEGIGKDRQELCSQGEGAARAAAHPHQGLGIGHPLAPSSLLRAGRSLLPFCSHPLASAGAGIIPQEHRFCHQQWEKGGDPIPSPSRLH